jgi:phosphohistidine phosphatase SixA
MRMEAYMLNRLLPLSAGLMLAACAAGPVKTLLPPQPLAEVLRSGGKVIYMRHTTADKGQDVRGPGAWWKPCGEGHRMLSEKGRADAVRIGESIRRLAIPVTELRCSEYCRAVETARLLGLGDPIPDSRLNYWHVWHSIDPKNWKKRVLRGMKELLSIRPEHGNLMFVSHKHDYPDPPHPVLGDLQDGECAVFAPNGRGKFALLGRIRIEDWDMMK